MKEVSAMGLFKKLAKDVFNQVVSDVKGQMSYYNGSNSGSDHNASINNNSNSNYNSGYGSNYYQQGQTSQNVSSPSGFSWGEVMPDEENQFNYNGPFTEYFEKIFTEEFPEYEISWNKPENSRSYIFSFYLYGDKKLIVEIMPCTSSAKALRERCHDAGMPYLRFYYDRHGWWNTRAYVIERTKKALGY